MDFGFTLKPDHSLERVISLTKLAEQCGFTHGWVFDSHVLWKEPYVLLTLMAQNSTTLRLGTCVTNPATREPSVTASALAVLQILSKGRMDLGIGRGDSARRVLGKKPTTLDDLEAATNAIRDLCEGRADLEAWLRARRDGHVDTRLSQGYSRNRGDDRRSVPPAPAKTRPHPGRARRADGRALERHRQVRKSDNCR